MLEVTVLLDLSGSRAPRGDAQRNALQLWQDLEQSRGGGRVRVRLSVVDVGGSDARLLIELRRAAAETRADAVIVGVPVGPSTSGFAEAAVAARTPILLTLPAGEPVATTGGRWIFGLAPTPEQIARRTTVVTESALDTIVITADGRPPDPEIGAVLEHWRRVARTEPQQVRIDRRDETLQAAVRLAGVPTAAGTGRRVHLAGLPREWGPLGTELKRSARGATYVLSYLTEHTDLGEFRVGLDAVWPAPRHLTLSAIPPNAAAAARRQFVQSFTDRHGPPTAHSAAAFDALTLLVLAAERVGAEDRERLREQLEVTGFTGVTTTYAFSVTRHAGYAGDDLVLYRWSGSAPVPDTRR
ncbi:MAG TPA: ABC transporter substrate-binding protein [Candidatus Limnocylindria bacterium]|nr:ABC transporter substrate-binding protein [Candidatus Limnocylindria bacterium]